jgi:hypothetical protein
MPARLPPGGLLTKKTSNERGLMSTTTAPRKEVIWMARPRNEVGGEVQYLTVRECALELGIHPQTLKNWLIGNVHGTRTLLEPVRVGFQSVMLIIPLDRFRRFQAQDWPAIRKKMEQRGWGPKPEEGGQL